MSPKVQNRLVLAAAPGCLVLIAGEGAWFRAANSQTAGEAAHLVTGYSYLLRGDNQFNPGSPPLMRAGGHAGVLVVWPSPGVLSLALAKWRAKDKIPGLNAARRFGIDAGAKRQGIKADKLTRLREEYRQAPAPGNTQYGWVWMGNDEPTVPVGTEGGVRRGVADPLAGQEDGGGEDSFFRKVRKTIQK
jgi:hypothetical protein